MYILPDYCKLQWQRLTNDRPDFSSERAPQKDKTVTLRGKKKSLVKSPRLGLTPRHTDWLTVSRNVTLTLRIYQISRNWENHRHERISYMKNDIKNFQKSWGIPDGKFERRGGVNSKCHFRILYVISAVCKNRRCTLLQKKQNNL
jgi:hypothetical protein